MNTAQICSTIETNNGSTIFVVVTDTKHFLIESDER